MREIFLLLWIYPNDKRLLHELRLYSYKESSLTDYVKLIFNSSTLEIMKLKKHMALKGMGFITAVDDNYPIVLKSAEHSPLIFSYLGDYRILHDFTSVSMVGSRNIDKNLKQWLSSSFTKKSDKFTYISGGAIGTDQAIHSACVKSFNKTVIVLPSGILNPYPKYLISKYIESESVLFISQFSPYQKIFKSNFHQRNYFISALSEAVVILQAKERSGTFVTAKYAIELNKDLYVLSCKPWDEGYSGNIRLLNEGANQITNLDLFQ